MGEIDRINPIIRPVAVPLATERVHPDADRQHPHQEQHDQLDLSNISPADEEEATAKPNQDDRDHGLDLAI